MGLSLSWSLGVGCARCPYVENWSSGICCWLLLLLCSVILLSIENRRVLLLLLLLLSLRCCLERGGSKLRNTCCTATRVHLWGCKSWWTCLCGSPCSRRYLRWLLCVLLLLLCLLILIGCWDSTRGIDLESRRNRGLRRSTHWSELSRSIGSLHTICRWLLS